jgi:hypothetical protein
VPKSLKFGGVKKILFAVGLILNEAEGLSLRKIAYPANIFHGVKPIFVRLAEVTRFD